MLNMARTEAKRTTKGTRKATITKPQTWWRLPSCRKFCLLVDYLIMRKAPPPAPDPNKLQTNPETDTIRSQNFRAVSDPKLGVRAAVQQLHGLSLKAHAEDLTIGDKKHVPALQHLWSMELARVAPHQKMENKIHPPRPNRKILAIGLQKK